MPARPVIVLLFRESIDPTIFMYVYGTDKGHVPVLYLNISFVDRLCTKPLCDFGVPQVSDVYCVHV